MLKANSFFALAAVTAAVVVAAAYNMVEDDPLPERGEALFPTLLERVNDVAQVTVTSQGEQFVLARENGKWVAPARDGYPLDGDKVHQLLVGAAGLVRLEPKTSSPELYPRLGVEDPDTPEAGGVGFALRTGDGSALVDVIVGEGKPARGNPLASEYYVRKRGDAQSWLVQGSLPDGTDRLTDWLAREIASIPAERVRDVSVTHPDGEVLTVKKAAPDSYEFVLADLPDDVEVEDAWRLNDMGRAFADLALEDVARSDGEPPPADRLRRVVLRTYDGLVVEMALFPGEDDAHHARLAARYDAALATQGLEARGGASGSDEAAVREEAAALNARWNGWTYRIPPYKADYLSRTRAELLPAPDADQKQEQGQDGAPAGPS